MATPEGNESPGGAAVVEPEPDESTEAVNECQIAADLLDKSDNQGAIASIDQCYAAMTQMPDDESSAQAKQDVRMLVAELIRRAYRAGPAKNGETIATWDLALPMVDNDNVQREIRSFTGPERQSFLEAYKRSGRYRPFILKKLEAAGLPSQLSWLPLVESSFKVNALSRASALGLWQFISSTGLRYGLHRDAWVDERLHPEKSTDAAIAYLTDLHQMFGDWAKALAAYNCGESRVQRLPQRSPNEYMDFWDLFAQLPSETRRYFPRLVAVLQLVEHPEKYGLELPDVDPALEDHVILKVERSIRLVDLEKSLGLEANALGALNPELRRGATPAEPYELRVPKSYADQAVSAIATLAAYVPPKEPEYVIHRVRSGETLSIIAERYRVGLSVIQRFNGLRSANRIWPGQKLRIPQR